MHHVFPHKNCKCNEMPNKTTSTTMVKRKTKLALVKLDNNGINYFHSIKCL